MHTKLILPIFARIRVNAWILSSRLFLPPGETFAAQRALTGKQELEVEMRHTGLVALAGVVVLLVGLRPASAAGDWNDDFAEQSEINQTYTLSPGASVRVNNIAGPVEISTWDGETAEVHIVQSARTKAELERKKILVENTPSSLAIYTEPNREKNRWNNVQVRQRVTLKLPRRVDLTINDIAGRVNIGEIDGGLQINDIAGPVDLALVNGSPHIHDIAGPVTLTVGDLGASGLLINDIAGPVKVMIPAATSADIAISDIAGRIGVEVPNVTVQGKINPESFHGKIGGGGPTITIHDIAGSVTIRN
jgi:hypothetical protein